MISPPAPLPSIQRGAGGTRKLADEVGIEIEYGDNETELELIRKEAEAVAKIK